MGSIYRQKRSKFWWIKYYREGRSHRESSGSERESDARRLLRLREGDIERGVAISPRVGRLTVDEGAADFLNDYRVNGKRSFADVECRLRKHLLPFFGGRRLASLTTADIRAYVAKRQAEVKVVRRARRVRTADGWREEPDVRRAPSNGEINRELTHLKRIFSLAIQSGKLVHKPFIPTLMESAPRAGFFEPEQFESVRAHLPSHYRGLVTVAYITGWRRGEITRLQWSQIDFLGRTVRLNPGTTKNDEGRVFPFTSELETVLLAQREMTRALQRDGILSPWVFHRSDGSRIQTFRRAWHTACRKAGCPGRILHDFRRTAVLNLERAGIPRSVAMAMVGHKTEAMYRRYAIVSSSDLTRAARQLDAAMGILSGIVPAGGPSTIAIY